MCDINSPSLKFCWDVQSSVYVVEIHVPDKCDGICFIFLHSFQLGLKLEAVVIDMVSGGDVSFPC